MLSSFSYCLNTSAGSRISCAAKCPAWSQSSSFLSSPSSNTSAAEIMDLDKSFCESRSGRTSKVIEIAEQTGLQHPVTVWLTLGLSQSMDTQSTSFFLSTMKSYCWKAWCSTGLKFTLQQLCLRIPLKSFWLGSVMKTNNQQKLTRTQSAKIINCWGLFPEGFWKD